MAEILTPRELKIRYRPRDVTEDGLSDAISEGRNDLIGYVGLAAVQDAETETPQNPERAKALKTALYHFAYAVLIFDVGSTLREGGRAKREGNIMGDVTVEYESAADTALRAEQHRALALKAIESYLLPAAQEEIETPKPARTKSVAVNYGW